MQHLTQAFMLAAFGAHILSSSGWAYWPRSTCWPPLAQAFLLIALSRCLDNAPGCSSLTLQAALSPGCTRPLPSHTQHAHTFQILWPWCISHIMCPPYWWRPRSSETQAHPNTSTIASSSMAWGSCRSMSQSLEVRPAKIRRTEIEWR